MSLTLTYLADLSRVRVEATDLPGTTALVERSVDQIRWATVRGGQAVPIVGGAFHLDDYEFTDATLNHYRVSTTGANTNLLTANQASVETDLTGWAALSGCTIARTTDQAAHGVASIEVTSTSSSVDFVDNPTELPITAGAAYTAVAEFRAAATPRGCRITLNFKDAPGGNIVNTVIGATVDDTTTGWTQVFATGVGSPGATVVEIFLQVLFSATDEVHYLDKIGLLEGTETTWAMPPETTTDSITPALDSVWLKSITRPFLNRPVRVADYSDVTRPSRNGIFDIVGRSFPVAVTDVRSSLQYALLVRTDTLDDADELDLVMASGDPIFLHVPPGFNDSSLPGGYFVVGDVVRRRIGVLNEIRLFTLPLTETAAPHHSIVGTTVTWASVLAAYATWADVIADNPTWADLLDRIGDPTDVVVP